MADKIRPYAISDNVLYLIWRLIAIPFQKMKKKFGEKMNGGGRAPQGRRTRGSHLCSLPSLGKEQVHVSFPHRGTADAKRRWKRLCKERILHFPSDDIHAPTSSGASRHLPIGGEWTNSRSFPFEGKGDRRPKAAVEEVVERIRTSLSNR